MIRQMVQRVEDVIQKGIAMEEELGEAPEEFLGRFHYCLSVDYRIDPLMYTVMEDPVLLPTSNITVDRATITSHLLSDSHDPFNRMPLVSFPSPLFAWSNLVDPGHGCAQ